MFQKFSSFRRRGNSNRRQLLKQRFFESLEQRRVLATHVWQGPIGGLWSDDANWDTGAPTTGEAGGTVVQFNGATGSIQDIAGLIIDRIHVTAGLNAVSGTTPLGISGSVLGDNILADGGAVTFTNTLNFDIALSGDDVEITITGTDTVKVSASLSGDVGLDIDGGGGTVEFDGPDANTYTGDTTVENGTLQLNKTAVDGAIAGNLIVGDGTGAADSAIVQSLRQNQIADDGAGDVTVKSDGSYQHLFIVGDNIGALTIDGGNVVVNGGIFVEGLLTMTGGAITGANSLVISNGATINASALTATISVFGLELGLATQAITVADGGATVDLDITSQVSNGGLQKNGAGAMRLSGDNTYSGGTELVAGTLLVGSDTALGTGDVNLTGGTIAADGAARTLANTVTLGGDFTVGGSENFTFNGAVLLDGDRTINVTNTALTTFAGAIGEATPGQSLTKSGAGTLVFTSANSYTGTTFVNEGTLQLNGTPGSNNVIIGDLVIGDDTGAANSATVELLANGQLANASGVTVNSDGRFLLGIGISDVIGALTVNAGAVVTGNGLSIQGLLTMTGGTISGAANLIINANAVINASADSALISSPVRLGGGTQVFTVADGAAAVDLDITGVVTDGGFQKNGPGAMRLTNANIYSGGTELVAGTLLVGSDTALGTGTLTLAGGTIAADGAARTLANPFTLGGDFTVGGSQDLTFDAPSLIDGDRTVTVTNTALTTIGGIMSEDTAGRSLTKAGVGTLVLTGNNIYTGTTTVNEGILRLNNTTSNNDTTIFGNLIVGDGTGADNSAVVELLDEFQIDSPVNVTVNSDGRFINFREGFNNLTVNGGTVDTFNDAGLMIQGLSMTGGTILGTAPLILQSDAMINASANSATISSPLALAGVRAFTVADGAAAIDLDISGEVSNGGLIKNGPGTLRLSGANTYSAGTQLEEGTVLVANNSALGTDTVQMNGATIAADGGAITLSNLISVFSSFTIGGANDLTFAGEINLAQNRTITVTNTGLTTFSGVVKDNGIGRSLTKAGAGTLVLTNDNTYTGSTFVNEGTLVLQGASVLGDLTVGDGAGAAGSAVVDMSASTNSLQNDATVTVNSDGRFINSDDIIGGLIVNGGSVLTGTQLLVLSSLQMTGGLIEGVGPLQLTTNVTINGSSDTATISAPVDLQNFGLNFTVANGAADIDLNITGAISDGSFLKNGAGSLRLDNPNNVLDFFQLEAGTLVVGADEVLGPNELRIFGGAIEAEGQRVLSNDIEVRDDFTIQGEQLTFHGAVLLGAPPLGQGFSITVEDGTTADFAGSVGDNNNGNGFTKEGLGTLILSSSSGNTYRGTTTVNQGILLLKTENELSQTEVNDGATLAGGATLGQTVAAGDVFVNDGGTLSPGDIPGNTAVFNVANLSLSTDATLIIDLNQPAPLILPDQLIVSGDVSLFGTPLLTVNLNYEPNVGDEIIIVAKDGTDPVSGTFNGIANGGEILSTGGAFPNERFRIFYNGGDGNDVVLRFIGDADDDFPSDPDTQPRDGANANFVRNLYEDLLDRAADQAGLNNWLEVLDRGFSRNFVANAFLHSSEYVGNLVQEFYDEFLGRAADATFNPGSNTFTGNDAFYFNLLLRGTREEDVIAGILGSAEFHQLAAIETYVTSLYETILGRAPDAGGLAFHSGRLNAGVSREAIVLDFLRSNELIGLLLDDPTGQIDFYEGWFQDYFEGADETNQPGFDGYFARLAAGDRWSDVQADILDSEEYFDATP